MPSATWPGSWSPRAPSSSAAPGPACDCGRSGEYPAAAHGAGVRVPLVRTLAVLWGGGLTGLAGAYLSIGYTNGFTENMSAGRGFIALAVVILGRWTPGGVALAALLFGLADALHYVLNAYGARAGFLGALPYQFLQALPYLLTLLALLFRSRLRATGPAALGEAYQPNAAVMCRPVRGAARWRAGRGERAFTVVRAWQAMPLPYWPYTAHRDGKCGIASLSRGQACLALPPRHAFPFMR